MQILIRLKSYLDLSSFKAKECGKQKHDQMPFRRINQVSKVIYD